MEYRIFFLIIQKDCVSTVARSMLLLPICTKKNLPPLSFIAESHLRSSKVIRQCLRLLSHLTAADLINVHQSSSVSPLIHDSRAAFLFSEESCLHFLSCCKSIPFSNKVFCVHSTIIKLGFDSHLLICNNLLSLYSKHGHTDIARNLFEEMPYKDIVSWTAVISAFVQNGNDEEALYLYRQMLFADLVPNHFTLSTVMRCAASVRDFYLGTSHHALILKRGFGSNFVLESGLLDFYSKCGMFDDALLVFELMNDRDTVSWTAVISVMVQAKDWKKALCLYISMLNDGVFLNE